MYSVVLMMALTSGADTPEIGGRRGGGCHGGCYGGCYGGGGRRGRHGGGGGCCGCYGGGYGGCYGGGYGGCYGGMGYGGCYGGMGYGGCYGGMGMMGYGGCMGGGIILQGTQGTQGTNPEKLKTKPKTGGETAAPAPATIVVDLPADARLQIDGEATTSTGNSRVFVSPALNPGREYHYTLKAEVRRDGKPVMVERVITVKAGEMTPVALTLPAASVAQR